MLPSLKERITVVTEDKFTIRVQILESVSPEELSEEHLEEQ